MSTSEVRCPLCGSNRAARLFTKRETDYWGCGDCTFRFATPDVNPNLTTALEGYEDAYLQYLAPDASDAANFDVLSQWMAGFAPLEGRRLLDVGAGSGKLVRFLRGRGVDATASNRRDCALRPFLAGDTAFGTRRSASSTPQIRGHSTSSPRSTRSPHPLHRRLSARGHDVSPAGRHVLRLHAGRREPDGQTVRPSVAFLLPVPSFVPGSANDRARGRATRPAPARCSSSREVALSGLHDSVCRGNDRRNPGAALGALVRRLVHTREPFRYDVRRVPTSPQPPAPSL